MSRTTDLQAPAVPPAEVARRIAEYRRFSLENKANPVIVYPAEQHGCPWAGCEAKISGIDFQLQQLGMPDKVDGWLTSWWSGPGLIGQCPGCGKYVRYGYAEKKAVDDVSSQARALLPENWFRAARIAPQPFE